MRDLALGKSRRFAALIAAGVLAFGVAACGDDDDDDSSGDDAATTEETTTDETASADEVTVTATEYDFELSATPTAETKTITFDNQGEEPHVLVYGTISEGFTLDEAVRLQGRKGSATTLAEAQAAPGKSVEVEVSETPEPGEYVMLCPIVGKDGPHYKLGQLEEFQIE